MSEESENPVQNKIITGALATKAEKEHTHPQYLSHPIILEENTDYGETFPESAQEGQLFFKTKSDRNINAAIDIQDEGLLTTSKE